MKILTFDIEIKNCVPDKDVPNNPAFKYCQGWDDKAGMGISFLGAHADWRDVKVTMFDEHNLEYFIMLIAEADLVTGYNIFGFDTPLIKATLARLGMGESTGMAGKCYDIFADIKKALGNRFPKGWTLENVAQSTLGYGKAGDGAEAPRLWQQGRYAELFNYLTQDLRVESFLVKHIFEHGWVTNEEAGHPERLQLEGYKKFL